MGLALSFKGLDARDIEFGFRKNLENAIYHSCSMSKGRWEVMPAPCIISGIVERHPACDTVRCTRDLFDVDTVINDCDFDRYMAIYGRRDIVDELCKAIHLFNPMLTGILIPDDQYTFSHLPVVESISRFIPCKEILTLLFGYAPCRQFVFP